MSTEEDRQRTVLVIDGCSDTHGQLQQWLRDRCRVLGAKTGEAGLASARRHRPDVILLGIALPDGDGFGVCQRLKSTLSTEAIPVAFMSSGASDDELAMSFGIGGADFIRKPLRRIEVQNRVSNLIRQRSRQRLYQRRGLYDELTQLPNRTLTLDRLRQALARDRENERKTALLFVDLDHFKSINDSIGHEAGDKLLIQAAGRFRTQLRKDDTVGRLGGDEFVIVLAGLSHADDARAVAEDITRAFEPPFRLNGISQRVSASIGIALSPDDGADADALVAHADTAMYQAKKQGRSRFEFYSAMMNVGLDRRMQMEAHLRQAVEREELRLHYQPVMNLDRELIVGAEALLRWHSPALGAVSPQEFIQPAEHSGLIWAMGEYVLRQACTDFRELRNAAGEPLGLSVNVSAQQLRHRGFARQVEVVLEQTGFSPERLALELTESLLLGAGRMAEQNLQQLRELGVRLSMSDFGSGVSSLSSLSRHRFHAIKLSRELIGAMLRDDAQARLVSASLAMARGLNLMVIAEGVETTAQLRWLRAGHCRFAQGHIFSPPVPLRSLQQGISRQKKDVKRVSRFLPDFRTALS